MYLDVYLIHIYRHSDHLVESLDTRLPDNVTLFQSDSAVKAFRFAQRIDLDQRVTVQRSNASGAYKSEVIQIDANRRFLTVNVGNLSNPSTDHTPKSGPGILVLDFDVKGFGLRTGKGGGIS